MRASLSYVCMNIAEKTYMILIYIYSKKFPNYILTIFSIRS